MNKRNIRLQANPARQYKDRVFRMIYRDKQQFLELYNALNETDYDNPEDLIVTTLENAIYLGMKNDISYLVYDELALYEHQSAINPNMALRDLLYVSHIYSELTVDEDIFGPRLIKIPAPQFVVFYNGIIEAPEEYEQRLSDAYERLEGEPALELKVKVLNINYGCNKELMNKCKSLKDYSIFVAKSREYRKQMDLKDAIELAITECIQEDVLADLLRRQRAEVLSMSLFEFNEELHRRNVEEYAKEEGMRKGIEEGMKKGMEKGIEKGAVLEKFHLVCKKINKGLSVEAIADFMEEDPEVIRKFHKILLENPEADDNKLYECYKA